MTETTSDPFAAAAVTTSKRLSSGYSWPECPRWHDGALHLTDMYNHRLLRLDESGTPEVVIDGSQRESRNGTEVIFGGFGWLPDGRIVVNSMHERLVLAWDGRELTEHADLSPQTRPPASPRAATEAARRRSRTRVGDSRPRTRSRGHPPAAQSSRARA